MCIYNKKKYKNGGPRRSGALCGGTVCAAPGPTLIQYMVNEIRDAMLEYFYLLQAWKLVDACLDEKFEHTEVVRSIQVGLLCVQHNPEDGPSMSTVI